MYLTALDFGSSEIKSIVAKTERDGMFSLLDVRRTESKGLRRGEVTDIDELTRTLTRLFREHGKIHRSAPKNNIISVSGARMRMHRSRGIVAVSRADNEIYSEDIERAIKASQGVSLGANRNILHTITNEFLVDGIGDIREPLGMSGNRLEIESVIIDVFKPQFQTLMKSIEIAGGKVGGVVYAPLASARAVVSRMQRELGVVMIDIGGTTTSMCVYEDDKLISAKVIPAGSANVTNDLAIGLRCSVELAEQIKLKFGHAYAKAVAAREKLNLQEFDQQLEKDVSKRFLAEIIEIRLAEIFEFVNNELKQIKRAGELPGGIVLTGGGSHLSGIAELAKQELRLPVKMGIPDTSLIESSSAEFDEQLENPEFAAAIGLLLSIGDQIPKSPAWKFSAKWFSKEWIKRLLQSFMP